MRDCGPGVAWGYATLKEIHNVTVLSGPPANNGGGTVRFYMEHGSQFAIHDCGFIEIINPRVWKAADAAIGWGYNATDGTFVDNMKVREFHPHEDDYYHGANQAPGSDGIPDLAHDGTGPWIFDSVTGIWEYIDLVANRDHHMSQSDVEDYLAASFHAVGSVNYPGSVHQSDYIAEGMGVDYIIEENPDMVLIERASATTPYTAPPGIEWDEWNEDADVFIDDIVDGVDYGICNLNLLKTAG
jgi:hypothetical protein